MSNDNKTMADVQPGGRVRLATVPYDRARDLIGDAYNAGTHGIGYSQQAMELHDAIIPVQPTPGGQDALHEAARRVISDIDSGDYGGTISMATYDALVAALAARQPVGEPVGRVRTRVDGGFIAELLPGVADRLSNMAPLYLHRPAQAVDLGQIWQQAFNDTAHSYRRNKSRMWVLQMLKERVQALIDSQAVGNG
ncbi:hypothetical protein [Stenotrophomonas maltophilia]|uniref:hypothetical protein n=1 Tax=Stenotrophomonas maltophilia TaxID=40324 RepID=UPI0018A1D4C4|nr:hypothetical protein [Stenotrophomonas maltophilia]